MTCEGMKGLSCSLVWFAFAITVFLAMILRRQCSDGILSGVSYNIYGAMGLGVLGVVVASAITASPQISLIAGLVGIAVGGFGGGLIMDTAGDMDT